MILVGIDESPGSARALRWAHHVAERCEERLVAVRAWSYGRLSAVPGAPPLPGPESMDDQVRTDAQRFVDDVLGAGADVEVRVARGVARHALTELALELAPSMVVVGHRGLSTPESMLVGSVGTRLIEHARCPVVMLRDTEAASEQGGRRIVVGVDGSAPAQHALGWAASIARRLDLELVVVHAAVAPARMALGAIDPVRASEDPVLAAADDWLEEQGIAHRCVLEWGDPRTALEDVAIREAAELLVVATRGVGGIRRLVVGSVASYVARHVGRPVAVVPPPGRS